MKNDYIEQILQAFSAGIASGAMVQGVLTIGLIALYGYMVLKGLTPPPALEQWTGLVIGFYFGGKAQAMAAPKDSGK